MTKFAEELTFLELTQILYRRRLHLALGVVLILSIAIGYLHLATYKYSAWLQLTATQQDGSSTKNGLSGLASLAGFNLSMSGQSTPPFILYIEALKSRQVAEALSKDQNLMIIAFNNQWNDKENIWQEPESFVRPLVKLVKKILGIPVYPWEPPGGIEMESFLKENVEIKEDAKNPMVTISFSHPDARFAEEFLKNLNRITDEILRQRTLNRSEQYINYLTKTLPNVTIAEHRVALAETLSGQEKLRMMASSGVSFAAEPFGNVAVSQHPTTPVAWLVLLSSLIIGLILGVVLVIVAELRDRA